MGEIQMRNPYDVLGVSAGASDEEIKKAYRSLSRKYHPDANVNNPNKEKAEEQFKEVQQAYQMIMDDREKGYTGGYDSYGRRTGYGTGSGSGSSSYGWGGYADPGRESYGPFGGFGGFGGAWGSGNTQSSYSEDDVHLRAAANYINSGHYKEALRVLSDISARDARWYYYSALANAGAGNNVIAKEHARSAASMEPGNAQYANLAASLENGNRVYRGMGEMYGSPLESSSDWCTRMCMANLLCNCLCGGRVCFC